MSNYVKSSNFTSKDALASGNPSKIIKGSEFDTEFNAIATAVATKADQSSLDTVSTTASGAAAGVAALKSHVSTDVTASRAVATNYTNSTGRIIHVTVTGNITQASSLLSWVVNGITSFGPQAYAINANVAISFSVGVGETYKVEVVGGGTLSLNRWVELR